MSDANVCVKCGWLYCRCQEGPQQKIFCLTESKKGVRGVIHVSVIGEGQKTACGIVMDHGQWRVLAMVHSSAMKTMNGVEPTCVRCKRRVHENYPETSESSEDDIAKSVMNAYSGSMVTLRDPQPWTISLTDIARGLSGIRRFNGHLRRRITVAHHSLAVARIVRQRSRSKSVVLCALLHDAHEAYIGDISSPVKHELGNAHKPLEWRVQQAILRALCPPEMDVAGLERNLPDVVKEADHMALHYEAATWLKTTWAKPVQLSPHAKAAYLLSEEDAEATFVETALELGAKR